MRNRSPNRLGGLGICLLVLLTLPSCKDFSSPNGVMASAYSALQDDDLKLFVQTLRGEALTQYGNESGFCNLQKRFLGLEARTGAAGLIRVDTDECGRDSRLTYRVNVLGREVRLANSPFNPVLEAIVECDLSYQRTGPNDEPDGGMDGGKLGGGCNGQARASSTFCQISVIE